MINVIIIIIIKYEVTTAFHIIVSWYAVGWTYGLANAGCDVLEIGWQHLMRYPESAAGVTAMLVCLE